MTIQDNILRFENLAKFDNLVHGFSTKFFGSMLPSQDTDKKSFKHFSEALGIDPQEIVRMDQVHEKTVYFAREKDRGTTIAETDGLITNEDKVFLSAITADCIPLLFYDPKTKSVGVVHAGWRGLFAEIIQEEISNFIAQGSDVKNILVGVGPSIRVCCYEVSEKFIKDFGEKFGNVEDFVERRNGKIFFNLQKVAKQQLLALEIAENNIEDADYCTFDHADVYSCRKEGPGFGEIMGVIGLKLFLD